MAILDLFERRPMRVDDAVCLNAKHKDRHCARCLACPNGAIQQHGSSVQLESTRCDECGLCVAVCPTRVFTFEKWDQDAILKMLVPFSSIEFACHRKENAGTTRGWDVQAAMVVPCLVGLSPDFLIALASDHAAVWLDDSLCVSCSKSAAVRERIHSSRNEANALLAGWNQGHAVHCYIEDHAELTRERRVQSVSRMSNPISRREFFSSFSRNVVQAAGFGAGQAKIPPQQPASADNLLASALTRLGLPDKEFLPSQRFATVNIAESCTACGLCSRICPTRAIKFQAEGDSFSITFLPRECLGTACDLCHLICPPDALTTSPGIANRVLCGEGLELHRGVLAVCEKCQLPFAGDGMQKLCSICRTEQAKNAALTRDLFK